MYRLADDYPGDAAFGGDYFSRAALGEIVTGTGRRREKVIVTDAFEDYEGRICVSERTVRHMAALIGLFTPEQVRELTQRCEYLEHELEASVEAHATVLRQVQAERAVRATGADELHEFEHKPIGALRSMDPEDHPVPTAEGAKT